MSISHAEIFGGKPDLAAAAAVAEIQALLMALRGVTSLAAMVRLTLTSLKALGLVLLGHVIEERDEKFRRSRCTVTCCNCGASMKRCKNIRQVSRYTLLGRLTYGRCDYHCMGCGARHYPQDDELQVPKNLRGHSLEFASELALLCVVVPFGKGCELFERLAGFAVSTQLARALTFEVGTRLFAAEMDKARHLWGQRFVSPEIFEPPPAKLRGIDRHERVYVMMDNSKVGIQNGKRGRKAPKLKTLAKQAKEARRKAARAAKRQKNGPVAPEATNNDLEDLVAKDGSWRDVRALLIFREEDLTQTSKTRREICHRRVVAHVGSKEEWTQLVHMAFHEEGVYTAREVVVVADGGGGIWELIAELLPSTSSRKVVEILDWYHAASHLWEVGRTLKGCKTPQERKRCAAWVHTLLDYLADGMVANVIQRLAKLKPSKGAATDVVRKCLNYFRTHRTRMRYQWCRAKGMLIGSGAIESVHAWVIQARCRLPGMRWSERGINAMLRLRCSWASGRWDEDFASAANQSEPTPRQINAAA